MTHACSGGRLVAAVIVAVALQLCCCAGAFANAAWTISAVANTTIQPGGTVQYFVQVTNVGSDFADGSPITVTATLPRGLTAISAAPSAGFGFGCPAASGTVVTCTSTDPIGPTSAESIVLDASLDSGASGVLTAGFDVAGGGASGPADTVDPVTVTDSPPGFGIGAFDGMAEDGSGNPLTQAGGHPESLTTSFDVTTATDPSPLTGSRHPVEDLKDAIVDLSPGLVGNPTGVAQCTVRELAETVPGTIAATPLCPVTSQVGTAIVRDSGVGSTTNLIGPVPVFNMVPPANAPARLGFNMLGNVVLLNASVRSGSDYGLTITATNTPQAIAIVGTTLTIWGVPSDPSHDGQRACPGKTNPWNGGPTCSSGAPRQSFFRNPTSCGPSGFGLPTTLHIDSWQHPGAFVSRSFYSHQPAGYPYAPVDWGPQVGVNGCDSVPFDPVFTAQPLADSTAGGPAAFTFDVTLPQSSDPSTTDESDLRKAVVTLPLGVHINASSADGLGACTLDQIALRSDAMPTCPDSSKIGSVKIDTPLLNVPVTGSVYLAKPFDNPFNSLLAVYIVASANGVVIKLPGQVITDPTTGQITTTFDNNPQLPFSNLHLEFFGGPRAPLSLPNQCGEYRTTAQLTGWNGRTVQLASSFSLSQNAKGQPCPSTFTPGFTAGTNSNRAGSSSTFLLRLTRNDEDQELKGVTVHLPKGLTGKIAETVLCSDADANAGTCPDGTKVGDVTVGAGAGSNPFYITNGRAYITGPYKGAPFGLEIVVPAIAGPFDLGTVKVRQALFVDKHDATVRVVSDPLPTILQGIPLDVRDVRVSLDRPGFMLNPTSCAEKHIDGSIESTAGATANVSSRFQAADCASLGFNPKMTVSIGSAGHTGAGASVPLSTTLTMPRSGSANLRYVRVTLPRTINARLPVINRACTRAQFEAGHCAGARAGTVVARTPLLRDPLRGGAYFVKNGHPLPDLFLALRGQVSFDLIGRVSIPGGTRLSTTFPAVPDVPVTSFSLRLVSGRQGPVGAVDNLCATQSRRATAAIDFIGQNGKVKQVDQRMSVHGCRAHTAHRRKRRR